MTMKDPLFSIRLIKPMKMITLHYVALIQHTKAILQWRNIIIINNLLHSRPAGINDTEAESLNKCFCPKNCMYALEVSRKYTITIGFFLFVFLSFNFKNKQTTDSSRRFEKLINRRKTN